ncbi:MAG: MarR family transcriptional regulator [Lachnospiraceae bacterium]|nr:MarR family transcriptional regulator [Lachnospiraceae bacterium]
MEYLNHVLGISIVYREDPPKSMPNYIHARYRFQKVTLDGKAAVFLYPKTELDAVSAVKKHVDRVQRTEGVPVVLVPAHLTYRQKEYLLRDHVPFIVEGRQIYLPFLAVYLQERGDGERQETEVMLPSAQQLLLSYIYQGCGELLTSEASCRLALTPTSISRASRQLEDMGLIRTEKRGVQKVIFSEKTPENLFRDAKRFLCNPVKRRIYVPKAKIKEKLLISGYSALAEYSMLNPPPVESFAADSVAAWDSAASKKLHDSDEQCAVELWRYDPKKLAEDGFVDRLSLALALGGERDERIEEAIEEMLAGVWKDIHGKRD